MKTNVINYFLKQCKLLLPVLTSHNLTVPSSEDVITNLVLNCKHVTAELCLFDPVYKQNKVYKIWQKIK